MPLGVWVHSIQKIYINIAYLLHKSFHCILKTNAHLLYDIFYLNFNRAVIALNSLLREQRGVCSL